MYRFKVFNGEEALTETSTIPITEKVVLIKPRGNDTVQDRFNSLLMFTDSNDADLYQSSLKEGFNFATFFPNFLAMLALKIYVDNSNSDIYDSKGTDLSLFITSVTFQYIAFIGLIFFTIAQFVMYCDKWFHPTLLRLSNYFLRIFLYGHIEDIIVFFTALGDGFNFILIVNNNICADEGNVFLINFCNETNDHDHYPLHQVLSSYALQLLLPIFLKCTNRYISIFSMVMLTIFMIASIIDGKYDFNVYQFYVAFTFLLAIYEFERFRLLLFLLSKEALLAEKINQAQSKKEAADQLERRMNQALLQQILPPQVAKQLLTGKQVEPENFEEVTIFFSDVVGFTDICAQVAPIQVVKMLNELYTVMDYCTSHFPLYKVETIGDAYMLVGGLPMRDTKHAQQIADFALLVKTAVRAVKSPVDGGSINIRIGIHSGPVMAGVVGNLMPRYCLFGDTVNTASRMESNGEAGRIHCSAKTAEILKATGKYIVIERGEIPIKGKGLMTTYWLDKAMDTNINANDLAIAKLEVMVQEILQSTDEHHNSFPDYHHHSSSNSGTDRWDIRVHNNLEIEEDDDSYNNNNYNSTYRNNNNSDSHLNHSINSVNFNNLDTIEETNEFSSSKFVDNGIDTYTSDSYRTQQQENHNTMHVDGSSDNIISPMSSKKSTLQKDSSFNTLRAASFRTLSPTPGGRAHSNPNALHSVRYNVTHRLSDTEEHTFSSSGAKILVVEDSSAQRKMLVQRLRHADPTWDISQAVNGEDALAKLTASRWRFDVVLVDENLSMDDGLAGHELVALMRRQKEMATCVIVACTSNPTKVSDDLIAAGVDYVWPKPPPLPSVIKPKIDALLIQRIKAFAISTEEQQALKK